MSRVARERRSVGGMSWAFAGALVIGSLAGCRAGSTSGAAEVLDLDAFSAPTRTMPSAGHDVAAGGTSSADTAVPPIAAVEPPAGDGASASLRPSLPDGPVLVDSMIGQVNGRPIFAHDFFAPIEDQIVALRAELGDQAWAAAVGEIVMDRLREIVVNALFLAEAEAELRPEEQQGVFAWLQQVEEQLVARSGGVESQARRKLADESGTSLEGRVEELRNEALISRLLQEEIEPRILVSWRDKEREYERRYDEFNPPAQVTIARIALFTRRQAATIETVTNQLAGGEPFLVLAEEHGEVEWQSFEALDGDLSEVDIAVEEVREQLVRLRNVGDTVGPFAVGARTWWLHLAEIDQPPRRDLYDGDVQRELARSIRARRGSEEQRRYIDRLLARGIYDEVNGMAANLLRIAGQRYGHLPGPR